MTFFCICMDGVFKKKKIINSLKTAHNQQKTFVLVQLIIDMGEYEVL